MATGSTVRTTLPASGAGSASATQAYRYFFAGNPTGGVSANSILTASLVLAAGRGGSGAAATLVAPSS